MLAVTGAEALYADMGHFGKRPIRLAWFALVLPALLLNYFGQGALLLRDPAAVANPFYFLAPRVDAAAAGRARDGRGGHRVAGADLGRVLADAAGGAARLLAARDDRAHVAQRGGPDLHPGGQQLADDRLCSCSSSAFRIVDGARAPRTASRSPARWRSRRCCSHVVARRAGTGRSPHVLPITIAFLAIDLSLFAANVIKIAYGGWVPLAIAIGVFTLMSTWKTGR